MVRRNHGRSQEIGPRAALQATYLWKERRATRKKIQSPNPFPSKPHLGATLGTFRTDTEVEEVAESGTEGLEKETGKGTSLLQIQR